MLVYVFDGDTYCVECGEAIRKKIFSPTELKEVDEKEMEFDSTDFPDGPSEIGESDCVEHCCCGENCLNPTVIDGQVCGCFLENDLTQRGVINLREMMKDGITPVIYFWVKYYQEHGYTI